MIQKKDLIKKNYNLDLPTQTFTYFFISLFTIFYLFVAYTSYGFDDEFFNIQIIENNDLLKTIEYINSIDFHPPLSYVLDWIFFKIFGSWKFVRVVISLLLITSIINFCNYLKNKKEIPNPLIFLLLIFSNPGILMWGTSLRWYSFYLIVLFWLLVIPSNKNFWFILKLPIGLLFLGYINYITFLIFIPLIIYYYYDSYNLLIEKKKLVIFSFLISIVLYAYQLNVFIKVHLSPGSSNQFKSFKLNLIGFVVANLSNQGLFPLSFFGLLSIISSISIFIFAIFEYSKYKNNLKNPLVFLIFLSSYFLTGLAGKYRNLILLEPFKYLTFSNLKYRKSLFILAALFCLISANLYGTYNVILHKNTLKNDWNTPTKQVLLKTRQINNACNNNIQTITYSPLFNYYLKKEGYKTLNLRNQNLDKLKYEIDDHETKCFLFVKTYKGSISQDKLNDLNNFFKNSNLILKSHYNFARDPHYLQKRKLDPSYPEFNTILEVYNKFNLS